MKDELSHIIAGYADDRNYLLELLHFWAWHPFAKLDRLAIVRFLEGCERNLETALGYLLANHVILRTNKNNVSLFTLTDVEPLRTQVLNLCRHKRSLVPPGRETTPQSLSRSASHV
ncbi:MAG: hypothetical protein HYX84_08145 [Chloroflexi bacterium]|nr:hypothetical protein [Chloroflexota bacterium]